MEKCYKISGRVQGVGYRYWAVRQAHAIGGISGFICNLSDGDVLVYLNGNEDALSEMYKLLYKGPLFAKVYQIEECPSAKQYFPPIQNGVFKRL